MQMNEPQVWILIGVFAASMLGLLTVLVRQHDSMIASLRREFAAQFEGSQGRTDAMGALLVAQIESMDARFTAQLETMEAKFTAQIEAMDAKFTAQLETMDARFTTQIETMEARLTAQLETLDTEVANLATRMWGTR
ncbi:hypothetical protein AB0O87_02130 [Microbacterium sp. NPDC076768]|uniref:hypothetical protein n=1 Tax=Microbacterium sp. NPDC076768 TaxID=3154858 RepID=UPI00343E79D4